RMFDQLKMRIEQKVRDIEEAIKNGADYVAEMKSVLQEGIETLNAIVADGKTDIQAFINQAKTDLTKVKDDATEDITTTAKNAKTSVQDTATNAMNSVNSKADEATQHVDGKVAEFNQTVLDNGFLSPEMLDEQFENLDWQKYRFTNNDVTRKYLLKGSFDSVHDLSPGLYETVAADDAETQDLPAVASNAFIEIDVTANESGGRKQIYMLTNYSKRLFLKTIHTNEVDKGWVEMTQSTSDSGWIPYNTINGVEKNVMYTDSSDKGFECAYRIIKQGDVITRKLRVNARKLTNGVTFAELPSAFSKNYQKFVVATPRNKTTGIIDVTPSGELKFNYYYNTADWIDTDYIYGEFTWHD